MAQERGWSLRLKKLRTSGIATPLLSFGVYLETCSLLLVINRGHVYLEVVGREEEADTGEGSEERWENLILAHIAEPLRKAYTWTFEYVN